jgi:hypothetical protein
MRSIIKRYIPKQLIKSDKIKQEKEIFKSRKLYKENKYHTRKRVTSFKSKKSTHIKNAERMYSIKSLKPNANLSKQTGCSIKGLKKIVNKGEGAYFSSGSRPNQTAHSWGYARLASSITGGKAAAVDFSIIESACKKSGKAYKLAIQSRKKNKYGQRRVPKIPKKVSRKITRKITRKSNRMY